MILLILLTIAMIAGVEKIKTPSSQKIITIIKMPGFLCTQYIIDSNKMESLSTKLINILISCRS